MSEYNVVIPEDAFSVVKFNQEDLPGTAIVNHSLRGFEPKVVFSWHLSLIIDFEESDEEGLPTEKEQGIIDPFEKEVDALVKGTDSDKPNALFLAHITWNNTIELVWRVFEPAVTNNLLQDLILKNNFSRSFDYKMENDPRWEFAQWYLKNRL